MTGQATRAPSLGGGLVRRFLSRRRRLCSRRLLCRGSPEQQKDRKDREAENNEAPTNSIGMDCLRLHERNPLDGAAQLAERAGRKLDYDQSFQILTGLKPTKGGTPQGPRAGDACQTAHRRAGAPGTARRHRFRLRAPAGIGGHEEG